MLTYKALIDDATKQLFDTSDTPRIDSEILIQHVLQKDMAWLIAYGDTIALAEHRKKFYTLIAKRLEGHPIAYLIGYRDFWTLRLNVNKNVLIPRPDTETLVEEALERLPRNQPLRVLDLGTGSGAIALSIAKERPLTYVLALEYHEGAIEVAQRNAVLNNISNVEFRVSNWFEALETSEKFDLIASNPPYVEPGDPHLGRGDLRFEPETALTALESGMADIRQIIKNASDYLEVNGWLIIEHGYNQAEFVAVLFAENNFKDITLFKDINTLPRCTLGRK